MKDILSVKTTIPFLQHYILVLLHNTILGMYSYFTLPIPHYYACYGLGQSDMLSLLSDQQDKAWPYIAFA